MAVEKKASEELIEMLRFAIQTRRGERLMEVLEQLPAAEAAESLDRLSPPELAAMFTLLGDEQLAEIVEKFDASDAARLIVKLSRAQAADVLEEMDPDDATDVVEELPPEEAEEILTEMEAPEAEDIRELMAYPPDTAGGRMTTEFVSLRAGLTADQALAAIRQVAREAETIYYVYVTDDDGRLHGVLNLRDLVLAASHSPIEHVTVHELVKVHADDDQETAARVLAERGLLAIPVVDADERLVGIITADDVADILEEEASEDIARLGGSGPLDVPYLRSTVVSLVKGRVGWLLMLFVAGAFTSTVLQYFEDMLAQVVVLAFFIPLLIGTGGNVGSQTVTTLVRAIALGEVHLWDVARILRKELAVATFLGLAMAAASYLRAWTMHVEPLVAIVVAVSAYLIVLWAAVVGAILPLVLRRVGADPAVASAPFISTLVDTTGLFLYFAIARALLGV